MSLSFKDFIIHVSIQEKIRDKTSIFEGYLQPRASFLDKITLPILMTTDV